MLRREATRSRQDNGRRLRPLLAFLFREPHVRSDIEAIERIVQHRVAVEVDALTVRRLEEQPDFLDAEAIS